MNTVDIEKIKKNLKNLIDLNDDTYSHSNTEIDVVCDYLHTMDNVDNGLGLFGNLLINAASIISGIKTLPAAAAIAWFLGGVIKTLTESPPPSIDTTFTKIKERYNATSLAIDNYLVNILSDVENNLDTELTIPDNLNLPPPYNTKKTFKIRELSDYDMPERYTPNFEACKDAHVIGFRYELTKQRLCKSDVTICAVHQFVSIYYTLNKSIPPGDDNDRRIGCYPYNSDYINYVDNWEVDDDKLNGNARLRLTVDSMDNFNNVAGNLLAQAGPIHFIVSERNSDHILYHKYFIVHNYSDNGTDWNLVNNTLISWLFKDDGFGKIINQNGVAMRDDVFRNFNITFSDKLPK